MSSFPSSCHSIMLLQHCFAPICRVLLFRWRLNEIVEDYSEADNKTWLAANGFDFKTCSSYWTATINTNEVYNFGGWLFGVSTGSLQLLNPKGITCVWPVRGGQTTTLDPRFTDNGDGTVTDNLTGLIWLKDASCVGGMMEWQEALDYVNGMNKGTYPKCNSGFTDWRLPNKNELFSLIEKTALPANHPFADVWSAYWTSSSYSGKAKWAWNVDVVSGAMTCGESSDDDGGDYHADCDKSTNYYGVWPVRGGQVSDGAQTQQCSYSLSAEAKTFTVTGGKDIISITASADDCEWTAASQRAAPPG